ncbi:MAG: LysR family transcriptional regulator [Devosia sp.]|nr:LysR family transcriptional regulator [Devosia sp.]
MPFDWNDARYLIAVARAGSTLGAARSLGVNQTTVARRIEALEQDLGIALFERRADGYRVTERGREALLLVQPMEQAATALLEASQAWRRDIAGVVRITTTEILATSVLAPLLSRLRDTQPALQVDLVADDRRLDPLRGEVDIAIRVGSEPQDPGLVRRRLGQSVWTLFCSRSYADRHGVPHDLNALRHHAIIAGSGSLAGLSSLLWLRGLAPDAPVALRCNSVPNLVAAVGAGVGIGPLPYFISADNPDLIRVLPDLDDTPRGDVWLIYPESLRQSPPVKFLVAALAETFATVRDRMAGRGPHWQEA